MRFTRTLSLTAILLLTTAFPAEAQTEGRVSVGASVTWVNPTDADVGSAVGVGPIVRLNPRRGWGPAGAFNWFRADLQEPSGMDAAFARLRVRPLMVGVAYTIGAERVLASFSLVAGPSFNRATLDDRFLARLPATALTPNIEAETSFAVRPGVNITWTVAPRAAIVGFGGYFITRPDIVYRDHFGSEFHNRWKADSVVLSIGAVYSLF